MSCNFGLKSYLWFQIELPLRARSILKSRIWFQIKLHSTQFNYHYLSLTINNDKRCIDEKPRATCDKWPDSPFKLPCIILLKKHWVVHISSESLPTSIFAFLWLSTLKTMISKSIYSILISMYLLRHYKENLLQNQDMVSMVIISSTFSSYGVIEFIMHSSKTKHCTLLESEGAV